jgi:SAM-dependent methyltransferase
MEHDRTVFADLMRIHARGEANLPQFGSVVSAHQYRIAYRTALRYIPPGSDVLDWGCGNGHFSYGLTKLGYNVAGYTFDPFRLRRHLPDSYELRMGSESDPRTIPYEDTRFDAAVSVGVLEHVRETGGDELSSLREIRRVLKPGAPFLCFHLPNRYSAIELTRSVVVRKAHHHEFRYKRRDIATLCAGAGLELVEAKRYALLPRNTWNRAPRALRDSKAVATAWDVLDAVLERILSPLDQNWLFVARRPS